MAEMIPASINSNSEATNGEKRVFGLLQDALNPNEDYLVWFEPKVINRYTDFIVFSQKFGLLIVEVKDWVISNIGEFNPRTFKGHFHGAEKEVLNPLAQSRDCANKIKGYLSEIPSLINSEGEHKGNIRFPIGHCVFFTNISRKDATEKGLLATTQIIGDKQALFSDDISFDTDDVEKCKEFVRKLKQAFLVTFYFNPLSYNDLKSLRYAIFPEVRVNIDKIRLRSEKDEALLKTLDLEQEKTAKSLGEGHRILKGVAGSGKTLVLACRVKYLKQLHPDWNILVVCYNISLRQYLRKLIDVSGLKSSSSNGVDIFHYHGLVKALTKADLTRSKTETDEEYDTRVGTILIGRIAEGKVKKGLYDAILVDEGQDFATVWMQGLAQLLNDNSDSMLFCYDPSQNVFGKQKPNWKTAGFKVQGKKPDELKKSYRNTVEILKYATTFGKIELQSKITTADLIDITLFPELATDRHGENPIMKFFNNDDSISKYILDEIDKYTKTKKCNYSDIGILYTDRHFPEYFESKFNERFDKEKLYWVTRDQKSKLELNIADQSVKLLTIESCKGLEFQIVFLVGLDEMPKKDRDEEAQRSLAYVGMTRAQDILYILSKSKKGYASELDKIIQKVDYVDVIDVGLRKQMKHASNPSNKILMHDVFKLYKEIRPSKLKKFGESEVGTLALYADRLVWSGKSSFEIPIHTIVNITIAGGIKYGFCLVIDIGDLLFEDYDPKDPMPTVALILPGGTNTSLDKVSSWRKTIDELRNS